MAAICMYLLYPEVILNLLQATSCFKSLKSEKIEGKTRADGHLDTQISRMTLLPEQYCDADYWEKYGSIIIPSLLVYLVAIPLMAIIFATLKKNAIFKASLSDKQLQIISNAQRLE